MDNFVFNNIVNFRCCKTLLFYFPLLLLSLYSSLPLSLSPSSFSLPLLPPSLPYRNTHLFPTLCDFECPLCHFSPTEGDPFLNFFLTSSLKPPLLPEGSADLVPPSLASALRDSSLMSAGSVRCLWCFNGVDCKESPRVTWVTCTKGIPGFFFNSRSDSENRPEMGRLGGVSIPVISGLRGAPRRSSWLLE